MAWIAADENGEIYIFIDKPKLNLIKTHWETVNTLGCHLVKAQCEDLIGKVLTWQDEPFEI